MTTPARLERLALCDLLDEVGPDAPTLCGDWTTRDLAAHLVVRERRPDAAIGIVAKPLADYGDKVRNAEALKPYADVVSRVRSGPPLWSPTRLDAVDRLANTVEFFVHHEDVRRAGDGEGGVAEARTLAPALEKDLRTALGRMGKMLVRSAPCGVVLQPSSDDRIVARSGEPAVTVSGPVGELILFVYGRQAHAHVTLDGPSDLVEKLRTARFGV